jgi:protein required for attachment to host cells
MISSALSVMRSPIAAGRMTRRAEMDLEHDTWVVIADGEKFLLLRNIGDREFLNLQVVEHEASENPPARDLASDRAGRRNDAARQKTGGDVEAWGKSAMEETDWQRVAETRFAAEVAAKLDGWAAAGRFRRLVVIADPRTLGALRDAYGAHVRSVLVAEIDKDLTNHPIDGIERSIRAHAG